MIRKFVLATAAVAALGAASLAVSATPAAAKGWGFHHHHGWGGFRFYGPAYAYDGCFRRVWVETRRGMRLRTINVCG